tara:strand:- start:2556 stop:2660 length:105 start_codon:yes stop_codon:yes gene_type:complete
MGSLMKYKVKNKNLTKLVAYLKKQNKTLIVKNEK